MRLATNGEDFFVGSTVHDTQNDQRNFALKRISTTLTRGGDEAEMYATASPVNDFCFATDVSLQGRRAGTIKLAAFAHGGDGKIGSSFLDISTGSYISIRDGWSKSEPLCVQFRSNDDAKSATHDMVAQCGAGGKHKLDLLCTHTRLCCLPYVRRRSF